MKKYKTIIRSVVTYSSETWNLTAKDEKEKKKILRYFERQMLGKIFGPVNIDNIRRI